MSEREAGTEAGTVAGTEARTEAGIDPGAEPADTALYFGLLTEAGIVAQLSRAIFEAADTGLTLPQFGVLNHLVRLGDGRTPQAIARAFQVPKPSMTHTLGLLEAGGLIRLAPNPRDGRSRLVHLTEAGRAARERAIAATAPALARAAAAFPPAEAAALLPLLAALRRALDEARAQDTRG